MTRLTACAILLLSAATVLAQQNVPSPLEDADERAEAAARALDELDRATNVLLSRSQTYTEAQRQAYNEWALTYTQGAYTWHHSSTVIIFWVVMAVVASGIVLAAWQLHAWISRVKAYDAVLIGRLQKGESVDGALVTGLGTGQGSTVDVKSRAVAVSSPYVGVVILGLSMGFFMAYLLLVYPVMAGP